MEENTLWMDKYKPRKLEELTFHPNQTELLKSLSENSEFPHLILPVKKPVFIVFYPRYTGTEYTK